MIQVLFGLGAALSWGSSDYIGGLQTRRLPVLSVAVWSQVAGLCAILIVIAGIAEPPVTQSIVWGIGGGLFVGVAVLLLYQGLATGIMGIVAPVSACGALIPVLFGLAIGEVPSVLAAVGILSAVIGIVLVSLPSNRHGEVDAGTTRSSVLLALGAALGIGMFYVFVDRGTGFEGASPLWTTTGVRLGSIAVLLAIVATRPGKARWPAAGIVPIAAVGILDATANTLFAFAAMSGPLGIAAILGSLYPVATLALGRAFLAERLTRTQAGGVTLALTGVALITAA